MKKLVQKILFILYILIVILATIVTIVVNCRNEQGVIKIFNYTPVVVIEDTLQPEIKINDLILVKEQPTYQKEDIISYISMNNNQTVIKTGKIEKITVLETNKQIFTIGETKENIDSSCIIGTQEKTFPKMGKLWKFLLSRDGFLLIFVAPLLAIFIYLLLQFINSLTIKQKKN